jgi:carboxyl-terminal processing protease
MTDLLDDREPVADAPPAADAPLPAEAPAADATPPPTPAPSFAPARRRALGPLPLALATVAVLGGAALFLSGFSLGARTATTPGTPAADAQLFAPFWDVYESITKSYVGDVDREKLVQGAIDGMIGALDDPYSSYMSPEELKKARESIAGEFSGVGAQVSTRPADPAAEPCTTIGPACRLVIVAPIGGSPAERAGLRSGDVITAVDGRSVEGETLDEAIARIRGPKGTAVTLTIVRDGGAPQELRIVRDTIVSRQVETRELAGGSVAYVRLAGFSDNAARQFEAAIRAAREQGVAKFVVDLRDNPGGYVTAARSIASQFIDEGPIFWEEAADGTQVATNAERGGAATGPEIRVAVLVNGGSASASEIVAGALQDTGRGTLVGETTYGKGTIQQWVDLTAESGGFRLTIAKWLTPDKRWIHEDGLQPDVVVPAGGAGAAEPGPTGDPSIDAALEVLDAAAAIPGLSRAA